MPSVKSPREQKINSRGPRKNKNSRGLRIKKICSEPDQTVRQCSAIARKSLSLLRLVWHFSEKSKTPKIYRVSSKEGLKHIAKKFLKEKYQNIQNSPIEAIKEKYQKEKN